MRPDGDRPLLLGRGPGAHRPGQVRVILPDVYLDLATDAGVFSPGRLDPGTRLLLDSAPRPPAGGDLLDLGCGYGPIACVLATRAPGASVWAVDVNERALALATRNAAGRGPGQRALRAARTIRRCRPGSPGSGPIPRSASASRPCTRCWRPGSPGCAPAARAYLVAGRNLGADSLHRWLAGAGLARDPPGRTERLPAAAVDHQAERAAVTAP